MRASGYVTMSTHCLFRQTVLQLSLAFNSRLLLNNGVLVVLVTTMDLSNRGQVYKCIKFTSVVTKQCSSSNNCEERTAMSKLTGYFLN